MYNRATSFIATMFRDFANENIARDDLNVIIVTHGLTLRLVRDSRGGIASKNWREEGVDAGVRLERLRYVGRA